jgi:hypothetical protein
VEKKMKRKELRTREIKIKEKSSLLKQNPQSQK